MNEDYRSTAAPDVLIQRARMLQATRRFFDERGFVEVQTPILSQDVIIDRHLDPMTVRVDWFPSRHEKDSKHEASGLLTAGSEWFLQTSPEQNMKRLLASGMKAIYQLGPVFRAAEVGGRHNPEFTMLEWYHTDHHFEEGLAFLGELIQTLLGAQPATRSTYQQVFSEIVEIDPLDATIEELSAWSVKNGLVDRLNWSSDKDDWLNLIFSMSIQDQLGHGAPLIVTHFPASQAALAKLDPADPRTAQRYELFYQGLELANGYYELLDAQVLRERNAEGNRLRGLDGKVLLPEENRLLDAMEAGLPECSGCALGFDRMVMIAVGVKEIEKVLTFPFSRA